MVPIYCGFHHSCLVPTTIGSAGAMVMSLVTNFDQTCDRSIAWEIVVQFLLGQNMTPPVFDVFYLHKYSHGFSNFNAIIIQFFRKTSVMTVATLEWQIPTIGNKCSHSVSEYLCMRHTLFKSTCSRQ